jgi:hypothetical protein
VPKPTNSPVVWRASTARSKNEVKATRAVVTGWRTFELEIHLMPVLLGQGRRLLLFALRTNRQLLRLSTFFRSAHELSSALWTESGSTGYGCRVDVFLSSQPLGSEVAGAKAGPTASGPSGRWRWEVGSCRVAGGDGTIAKVDFGAPRRRRPRTPAPPKPPKRCPYQRPGPGPRPPLARRAGRGRGGEHQAVGLRTGAAAGALRRGRRVLRSQGYVARL